MHGVDAHQVRVGADGLGVYFTKAAREVTSSYAKDSRAGRSPLGVLRDAVGTYLANDVALWWEWEYASRGRKQLSWSTGDLWMLAGLRAERTYEDVAAEDNRGDDLIALTGHAWDVVARAGETSKVPDVAEVGGMPAACASLDARAVDWSAPGAPGRPRRRTGVSPSPQTTHEARAALRSPEGWCVGLEGG